MIVRRKQGSDLNLRRADTEGACGTMEMVSVLVPPQYQSRDGRLCGIKEHNSTIIITPFTPFYTAGVWNLPSQTFTQLQNGEEINHVSKHFYFYASVKLRNISDLGIKILLNRKLQIASYGETSCWSTVCGFGVEVRVELPLLGGNYCEMWSHCLEPPSPPNPSSPAVQRHICFSGNVIS